ncbi:hypothetical protein DKX38_006729 [Salix brachista]|uniref:Uncharacterized protein n=1 Tax=Salix brachista TaxID=2182728 RepID=A0A5N5N3K3_9ROSI|nr:hypothetical protein DKX38_006729 [Salix brachista]
MRSYVEIVQPKRGEREKGCWFGFALGQEKCLVMAMVLDTDGLECVRDGLDNFRVTVYPNVDYAFIVALEMILDEINADLSDINGTVIFQVTKKLFSLTDRRFLKDAAGNTIVNLKRKIMSLHQTWEVYRGESDEEKDKLFTIEKSKLFQLKTELDVFLANHNEGELPDFKVKGEFGESACSVLLGDSNTMLAQVSSMLSLI